MKGILGLYVSLFGLHTNTAVLRFFTVRKRSLRRSCLYTCLSFCPRGGTVCLSACWDTHIPGRRPPGQTPQADTPLGRPSGKTPPWPDTPLGRHPKADTPLGRHPLGRHPLSRHPPGQTPPWPDTPWADTPGQTPPCPVHARIHTPLAQCILGYTVPSTCWDRHGYCCGWYASYWNAFFFIFKYILKLMSVRNIHVKGATSSKCYCSSILREHGKISCLRGLSF